MCNYYSRTRDVHHVRDLFSVEFVPPTNYEPRVVVRPTNTEMVVRHAGGRREMVAARWDLVPHWAKDEKTGYSTFNARDDNVRKAPSFRDAWAWGQRCLVPFDGYFESQGPTGRKTHFFIRAADRRMLAFAGLWSSWVGPVGAQRETPLISYTFLTTSPNTTIQPVHTRMPVILATPEEQGAWLDPGASGDALSALIRPAPEDLLVVRTASPSILKIKDYRPSTDDLEPAELN